MSRWFMGISFGRVDATDSCRSARGGPGAARASVVQSCRILTPAASRRPARRYSTRRRTAGPPPLPASPTLQDFARQIQQLQPQLLRFARTQLRNDAWAED